MDVKKKIKAKKLRDRGRKRKRNDGIEPKPVSDQVIQRYLGFGSVDGGTLFGSKVFLPHRKRETQTRNIEQPFDEDVDDDEGREFISI